MRSLMIFGVAAATVLSGCDEVCVPGDLEDEVTARKVQTNGVRLNGTRLNGVRLNGTRLNGTRLNGDDGSAEYVDLVSIHAKGTKPVSEAWLSGTNLYIQAQDGELLSGVQLDKSKFVFDIFETSKQRDVQAKIRDITLLAPGSDVWLYDLDVKDGEGAWEPLCLDDQGESTEAILLPDVWDPVTGAKVTPRPSGALTFACRGAALAKCAEWGYLPGKVVDGVDLAAHHQACTRLARADYCGDGQSHTVNGTSIHVLDKLGVQGLDTNANFAVEAEWGPEGAVCLNPENMRLGAQALGCVIPACGPGFVNGGLIQSGKMVPGP